MDKKLAIIHTTPVTIEPLKNLASELIPEVKVINLLDDSILPQLIENGGNVAEVRERWFTYAKIAESLGADVILNACSSVGELADELNGKLSVPVIRIDEAMTERAVTLGSVIGVVATLSTTLKPTINLIRVKAEKAGKRVTVEPVLVDEAYKLLMQGDGEGHDRVLAKRLNDLAQKVDVVVLAQASMARVLDRLPDEIKDKFLTSPRLGIIKVRDILRGV
ncbi:Asp/Glu/hydantoin racemase [Caldicoprobacter guelmensis]|uniref:aspartate/glutamate racemase family protein n=1 Tax=Caldicoprobacter guelmensis TaxID=1170224 RepID=UPI001958EFBF|nr:aspartate/glutamate racemase family protein [Caldicoprobacter guelmensis]MBM7582345.1 Asp/Glu/hydantoin racemase [Caldicoprobacter guelmensis]